MTVFAICLVIAIIIFMWGVYRFKSYDYMAGFMIGAIVFFLLVMGSAAAGIW